MNNSCIRDTGSTSDAAFLNQRLKPIDISIDGTKELSKSVEVAVIASKRKEIVVQSISDSGISLDMHSNLRPPKKFQSFKTNKKIGRFNQSIVLRPKVILFPRLNSLSSAKEDKQTGIEKSKSSKKSVQLRRILTYGHSLRGERKNFPKINGFNCSHEQNKLQKTDLSNLFLVSLPKNKVSQITSQPKTEQDSVKHIKIKRFVSQMFCEDGQKHFFCQGQKPSKQ